MITCLMKNSRQWDFGGIGASGAHFTAKKEYHENGSSKVSSSGHNTDANSQLHKLKEGATFIDSSRIANTQEFQKLVINGPMLDLDLPPGAIDEFKIEPGNMLLNGMTGVFKAQLEAASIGWKGLDYVSLPDYVFLYQLAGSNIGVRHGDEMHWEQYEEKWVTDIQPCLCWERVCRSCNKLRYWVDRGREIAHPDDHCPECR